MGNPAPDLIIGIDLGTTGTAVALVRPTTGIVQTFQNWPNDNADRPSAKVPSIVAFEDQTVSQWGFSVLQFDTELLSASDIIYRQFKQQFDSDDSETMIQAQVAMTLYLQEIYDHLERELQDKLPRNTKWQDACIKFVFSFPATWDSDTCNRFRTVIMDAGFGSCSKHTCATTLNEAEASLMYHMRDPSKSDRPEVGDVVLMADIGGGTTDVAIFKVGSLEGHKTKLDLLANGRGTYTGGTHIDDAFREKLRRVLTPRYKDSLQRQQRRSIEDNSDALQKLVNAAVFNIDHKQNYIVHKKNYGANQRNGKLQKNFFDLTFNGVSTQSEYSEPSLSSAFQMRFDKDEYFWDAFEWHADAIWKICEEQMQTVNGVRIDRIVLGGGFSHSPFVQNALKSKFKEHSMSRKAQVKVIEDYSVAVSQGLVHNELNETYDNSTWTYPAEKTYGLRQGHEKPEWIVEKGDRVKIPRDIDIKLSVKIQAGVEPWDIFKHVDLSLVSNADERPSDREGRRRWLDNFREIDGQHEFKQWVQKSLPRHIKLKTHRFSTDRFDLVITAKMARGMLVLSMQCNGVKPDHDPLVLQRAMA